MIKEDSNKRYCDVCGKVITGDYFAVEAGRRDWGVVEHHDLCSDTCLTAMYNRYLESLNGDYGYFTVERRTDIPVKYGISQKDWEEFWA